MKLCILICSVLAAASAASFERKPRKVVGGIQIDIEDAPYQVSLQLSGGHICGGSVIAESWIMTAAHCVENNAFRYSVRVGSTAHAEGGTVHKIAKIISHPNYDGDKLDYDYALLELETPVELSESVAIVDLPEAGEKIIDDSRVMVSGWGDTFSYDESSDLLRAVVIPTVNQDQCIEDYKHFMRITKRMLCAGFRAGGKDSCQGDSGGPLVMDNKLVGVVSWGKGCAMAKYPGVYARVAYVRDWVREVSGV